HKTASPPCKPGIGRMIPELQSGGRGLDSGGGVVRLPPGDNVPVTRRVRRLIDTAAFQRLAGISQLGMVARVYPGACHHRLEHSLGVYDVARQFLLHFYGDPVARERLPADFFDDDSAAVFLVAALLHDVGHWPFCHPIEDMQLPDQPSHETALAEIIRSGELADAMDQDWGIDPSRVLNLVDPPKPSATHPRESAIHRGDASDAFLASCLSGPVDVDKIDYLQRDSLHAGVPYGRHFDVARLIGNLTVHPHRPRLAVGEKAKTAAEMMVFARYIMFSEVYWHRTVRAATAMLQRAVFLLQHRMDLASMRRMGDSDWVRSLRRAASGTTAESIVEGLFGKRRQLYKCVAEFDGTDESGVHQSLARRPFWYLVTIAESIADRLSSHAGIAIHPSDVLIDAPPVQLEVDINMDVVRASGDVVPLGTLSPVASSLARDQFDGRVKRVRVFVRPDLRDRLGDRVPAKQWTGMLRDVSETMLQELA
ncbi:MAG: HD domain-containing protein, partial [Planctomycetota bacterium]